MVRKIYPYISVYAKRRLAANDDVVCGFVCLGLLTMFILFDKRKGD